MRALFAPSGPLALDPRAFGLLFESQDTPTSLVGGAAVVTVRGPLTSGRIGFFDSYAAILDRVDAALAQSPRAIVLDIDSPGGSAQGCFEAAVALRARCDSARVPLFAFVKGSACSAAYALACVADRIGVTSTAVLGSIGVYEQLVSQAAADQAQGLAFKVVSTGARKADNNPHLPISDGAIAAAEAAVEQLGELFFALVAERRGIPAEQVRALEGGIAIGRAAITRRLADLEVSDLAQLLETVSAAAQTTPKEKTMDDIQKALQALIDNPNTPEDEKARAAAALAALTEKTSAPAAAEEPKKPEPVKDNDAELAAKAFAEVHKLRAEIAQRDEEQARNALLAERPDLSAEFVASLRKLPLASAREIVATAPRTANLLAAAATVQPTLGKGQISDPHRLPPEASARLAERMGLTPKTYGVINVGNEQLFGVPIPLKS